MHPPLTLCVTGHRQLPARHWRTICTGLEKAIDQALQDGYTRFLCGFAEGADLLFAQMVAQRRASRPELELEAVIPYRGRYERLMASTDTRVLLEACTRVHVLSEVYAKHVFMARNQFMIARSQRLIAVYDGRSAGGTAATVGMAIRGGLEICQVLPQADEKRLRDDP